MNEERQDFILPSRQSLSEAEWLWVDLLKSIMGAQLPPVTLGAAQAVQIALDRAYD